MRLFIQLNWYFCREWRRYLSAIIILVIIAILQLIPPKVVEYIIDEVVKKHYSTLNILVWIGILIMTSLIVYSLRYIWRVLLFGAAYQLAIDLREKFYLQLSRQNPEFYLHHRTGDLISRVTNDVDCVVFAAGEGVLALVDSLVMGCAVLTIMSTQISWQLTFLSLLPMPIMAAVIKNYGKKLHERFKVAQAAFSLLNERTQECMTSIRMIKAFGLENYQLGLFTSDITNAGAKNMRVARIDACFDPTIYITIGVANLIAISIGSWMVMKGSLTLGQLTSFAMYLGLMIWPMLALAWMFNIVERGSAAYSRIRSILIETPTIKDGTESLSEESKEGILTVKINSFTWPRSNKPALKNVHFTLRLGETLGICGPTGSGKSTVLSLIQRHFDLDHGNIRFNDIPLSRLRLEYWRSKLAVVSQKSFLFSDTIANNIALGNPDATQDEIEHASYLASIHEDILRLPHGYNTKVGERGVMISGGQKQRIAIARALLFNADILILDDALSAIDGYTEKQILYNLHRLNKKTIIITSHRLSTLIRANEILVLQHGQVAQRGQHVHLVKSPGWYRDMFCYQQMEETLNNMCL